MIYYIWRADALALYRKEKKNEKIEFFLRRDLLDRERYIWFTQSLRYSGRVAQAKAFALLLVLMAFTVRHAV